MKKIMANNNYHSLKSHLVIVVFLAFYLNATQPMNRFTESLDLSDESMKNINQQIKTMNKMTMMKTANKNALFIYLKNHIANE
jgi:hypothetical protein